MTTYNDVKTDRGSSESVPPQQPGEPAVTHGEPTAGQAVTETEASVKQASTRVEPAVAQSRVNSEPPVARSEAQVGTLTAKATPAPSSEATSPSTAAPPAQPVAVSHRPASAAAARPSVPSARTRSGAAEPVAVGAGRPALEFWSAARALGAQDPALSASSHSLAPNSPPGVSATPPVAPRPDAPASRELPTAFPAPERAAPQAHCSSPLVRCSWRFSSCTRRRFSRGSSWPRPRGGRSPSSRAPSALAEPSGLI